MCFSARSWENQWDFNFWTFVNLICGQYFTVQDFFFRFFYSVNSLFPYFIGYLHFVCPSFFLVCLACAECKKRNVWHYIMINHLYHFFMKCLSTATRYIQIFSAQFLQNLAGIKPKKTLLIRKFVWQMFTSEEIHSFLVLKWNFLVWKTKPAGDGFTEFVWHLFLIQWDYNPILFKKVIERLKTLFWKVKPVSEEF